jgi:hypothetical protein
MAPIGFGQSALQARQIEDGDGPTHVELLGICVAGLCVILLAIFLGRSLYKKLRARRYFSRSASSNLRLEATAISPLAATFPPHIKSMHSTSSTTIETSEVTPTEPSPIYDAIKAGRPPSYRTSILVWREDAAKEMASGHWIERR